MSDISDLHSRFSQISHSQHGQQQSNSFYNNRPQATNSAAHQRGASRQSSRRSSVSSNVSENSRTTGRKSRSHSVERIPSREYMPPPQTPSIQSYSANTTRDPSTGYGSGISQVIIILNPLLLLMPFWSLADSSNFKIIWAYLKKVLFLISLKFENVSRRQTR